MKIISFILLACMVVMMTGCPKSIYSTKPSTELGKNKLVNQVNEFLVNRQTAYYCAINNGTVKYSFSEKLGIQYSCVPVDTVKVDALTPENEAIARRIRKEVIEKGVTAIDGVYNEFIDELNTGRATTNFVADVIDLGVGAAVGIVKGERPLQILGVALTAFRGGRKSIDINFFREQTVPILVNKMDDNRAKIYNEMIQKQDASKPVTDYPMEEVVRDIVRYYNAGTLIRAFGELAKDTAATAKESERKVLEQKGVNLDRPFTKDEIEGSKTNFGGIRGIRESLVDARGKKDQKKIDEVTKTYESVYALIINDPILKPVVEQLLGQGDAFVSPPVKNIIGIDKDCINTEDRNFTEQVKNKEKLKCSDDYDTFLAEISSLLTSDLSKFAKQNDRFQKILSENGVIKK